VGSQYRSVIFTYDEEQRKAAQTSKAKLERSGKHSRKIVTIIEPAAEFWRAEEYHQRYYEKKGIDPTCHVPAGN
jgi:peptide-methionine (S)-S-oxide reductase